MQQDKSLTDLYWTSPHNYLEEIRSQFTLPKDGKVVIHDVTLREAEQSPGIVLRPEEKIRIAQALDELGVARIEIYPMVSEGDKEATKAISKLGLKAKTICLCRWERVDVDMALECGTPGVMIEVTCNPWSVKVLFGLDEKEFIAKLVDIGKYAKSNGLFTVLEPWDTFRAPLPFLERMCKTLVEEGSCDHISISDTHGFSLPWTTAYVVRKIRSWVPGIPIEIHGHNNYGLATALMLSAVIGGASVVHTSINGLGERCGNAATEEVALALELLLGLDTGIDLSKLYEISVLVQDITKFKVAPNKPVVGDNLFLSASGMTHFSYPKAAQAGRPTAFTAFMPQLIGREKYKFVLGKTSGQNTIKIKLEELGLTATDKEIREITKRVKQEGIIRKGIVTDPVFTKIVDQVKHVR
jgi:2-isopropylmalate synthase